MHNPEKDAAQMAANRQRFLETGFRLFTERTIAAVSLETVAKESGIGVATLYRYFGSKADLAVAVSAWKWEGFLEQLRQTPDASRRADTGAENFAFYLDSFLDLYKNHRDLLRYNQLFNVYLLGKEAERVRLEPYERVIARFAERFRLIWEKGARDGTLRTEIPWQEAFSATLHMMLAAVTRYAVGLVYRPEGAAEPEEELLILRDLLLGRYTRA